MMAVLTFECFDNRYIDNKARRISRQTPFYPAITSRKLLIDSFIPPIDFEKLLGFRF